MNKKVPMLAMSLSLVLLLPVFLASATDTAWTIPNVYDFGIYHDMITYASIGEPETVDPHWAYDTASAELITNVYDTLIRFPREQVPSDPADFEPDIADSWWISSDGLTYRFHIKSGVAWQDGTYGTVTPRDVEWSIEAGMVMDHAGGPFWMFYEPLTGAFNSKPWNLSDPTEAADLGHIIDDAVQVVDAAGNPDPAGEYVQFNLYQPYAPFMQVLSQSWGSIMDEDWGTAKGKFPGFDDTGYVNWRDYNDRYAPMEHSPLDVSLPGGRKGVMMGSGPYKFIEWIVGNYWMIEKFDGYHRGWPAATAGDYVTRVKEKLVELWTDRKFMFLSDDPAAQADLVDVPRAYIAEIKDQPGVRGVKDLPLLVLSPALHYNYNVSAPGTYFTTNMPKLGGADKPDLLSDIHMRKAFSHTLDFATFIADQYLGEASQSASCMIEGLAFWNASWPKYTYDLTEAIKEFKLAWGGAAWNSGFEISITYNSGNVARETAAKMIERAIEVDIPAIETPPGTITINAVGLPWGAQYIPALINFELPMFMIGWLADYADPHNFAMPYYDPWGDFAYFQNIQYGQSTLVQKTWPWLTFTSKPGAPLNNTYVDLLIMEGIKQTDPAIRQTIYNEIALIGYEEIPTLPICQPLGRHWERDWVQGWYYNPITPGNYYYEIWKGLDADVTGPSATETHPYGYVDISDAGVISYHLYWAGGVGPGGYNAKADIFPVSELDGEDYKIPGADGLVDLSDATLINAMWHDYVVPNPSPP